MEIITKNNYCIITPLSSKLDIHETDRIIKAVTDNQKENIGLNLEMVKDCTIDFFEKIISIKNLSLFNIHSDIFAILNCMNLDKTIKIFVSELDFYENKRQLINRNFTLIKNSN